MQTPELSHFKELAASADKELKVLEELSEMGALLIPGQALVLAVQTDSGLIASQVVNEITPDNTFSASHHFNEAGRRMTDAGFLTLLALSESEPTGLHIHLSQQVTEFVKGLEVVSVPIDWGI